MLRQWYDAAVKETGKVFTDSISTFTFYKGFKLISLVEGGYRIQDVRYRDVYSDLHDKDLQYIKDLGLIRGVDLIGYLRDVKRVSQYKKRLEKLFPQFAELKKKRDAKSKAKF